MTAIGDRIADEAARTGRPLPEASRHHILEGLLRRLARLPHADSFVLRGGMLARHWARPVSRPAQDIDFVGTFPADVAETTRRFRPMLADSGIDDGVRFDPSTLRARGIWQESEFPGVRLFMRAGLDGLDRDFQVDVGFNDPLVPPAELVDYPTPAFGGSARVWCCRPETAVGWKLHGLAETGERRWRPKDLHDLWLIGGSVPLDPTELASAITVAFESRGYPVESARAVLSSSAWWGSKRSWLRWEEFRDSAIAQEIPADLAAVVAEVAAQLGPTLDRISEGGTSP